MVDAKAVARGYDAEQRYVFPSDSQLSLDQGFIQSTPSNTTDTNGKIDCVPSEEETHVPQSKNLQENQRTFTYVHGLKAEAGSIIDSRPAMASTPKHFNPDPFPSFGLPYPDYKPENLLTYNSNLPLDSVRPPCCQKKHEGTHNSILENQNQEGRIVDSKNPLVQTTLISSDIHNVCHHPSPNPSFDPKLNYGYIILDHQWIPHLNQTTLYTIPPTYATASHPLNPSQLAQLQHSHTGFSQIVPQYAPSGLMGSAAPSAEGTMMFNPAHNCNCGDNCLCLGCAAHPYNATTRNHVQDLRQILENSHETNNPPSRPQTSYGNPANMIDVHSMTPGIVTHIGDLPSPTRSESLQMASLTGASFHQSSNNSSPTQSTFPMYSSSGYYTMEFPMEQEFPMMGCTDVSGSCQCGSDCACIGCLTHTGHDDNDSMNATNVQEQPSQSFNQAIVPVSDQSASASTTPRPSCCG